MAEQLNDILSPRCLSAQDVKGKIGNLATEYRRKKKEQGKTGASPCTWPYFDLIDKIVGKFLCFFLFYEDFLPKTTLS
jgi:hypothetical protein